MLITVGFYALTGREVSTATVAAILTVLGYSIYDTIIIFDRIRENVPLMRRASFRVIGNVSLWEVLPRSLATTFITLVPIASLYFFGGDTLKDFAFALLVGIGFGAYSSIFLAAPLVAVFMERQPEFARRRDDLGALEGVESVGGAAASDVDVDGGRRAGDETELRPGEPEPAPVSFAGARRRRRPGPDVVEARAPPPAPRVEAAWPNALARPSEPRSRPRARRPRPARARPPSASTRSRTSSRSGSGRLGRAAGGAHGHARELAPRGAAVGDSAGDAASSVIADLGIASRDAVSELELRVAQLEHRLKLARARPVAAARAVPTIPRMATRQRNLGRLSEIAQVAARHGFGYFLRRNRLGDLVTGGENGAGEATASDRGRRLREMLDELGPTFVKFGQLLSTRPDVVPPDIVIELRGLQDDVTPFPFEQVREMVEEELGLTVEQAFLEFDELPLASASIGQVHRAVLPDGQVVAVKVQRPEASRQIEADLGLLYQAAKLLRERVRALEFIDPRELVDEFARSIRLELDYGHEARNADAFRRNFENDPRVVVPRVIRTYSTTRILTLEFLDGTKVSELDVDALNPDERRDDRLQDGRHLDDDGLPARVLPLRPAPGQHLRHAERRARARRLRPGREADRRGHVQADAALRRRGDGERGRDPAPSEATSASATRPSASRSSGPSCACCSTATTALGSPTSTRCR